MKRYSVKQVARIAGVTVRTLHLYDKIGLLKPGLRTEAKYRMYGEPELLRLQQILFYRELDFSLEQIGLVLDDPGFDPVHALEEQRRALQQRRERIEQLLKTIDKTIVHLKEGNMMTPEELYEGLPKEQADAWRREATEKYGAESVGQSEQHLREKTKADFTRLKAEQEDIARKLAALAGEDPADPLVQQQIARHYANIREFWGTAGSSNLQAEAYKGLGQLYVSDPRFSANYDQYNPEFALFLSKAMTYFADTSLGK